MRVFRLLLAAPALLVGLAAAPEAHAESCTDVSGTNAHCGGTYSGSVASKFVDLFNGDPAYGGACGGVTRDQPGKNYPFTCPPGGATVKVTVTNSGCDNDLFVLVDGCAEGNCVGYQDGGDGGTRSVTFHCPAYTTAYLDVERGGAGGAFPSWVPFVGEDCSFWDDYGYQMRVTCYEDCNDLFDNDQDLLVDCLDPDCPVCHEICNDNIDNDFDSTIDCADIDCAGDDFCCDRDGDDYMANTGVCVGDDCNDNPASGGAQINPGMPEKIADEKDSNCDGRELCYVDQDGDHWGIEATVLSTNITCMGPGVANKDPGHPDCNDLDPTVNPSTAEIPVNGIDDDCDGNEACYEDNDADGYGTTKIRLTGDLTCSSPGVSKNALDCDDTNYFAHPGALEVPIDGVDENCDGKELCFEDQDGDTYGNPNKTIATPFITCRAPGVAIDNTDCNDTPGTGFNIHPGATEQPADGIDADCDRQEACYYDNDDDNFGNKDGRIRLASDLTCSVERFVSTSKDDCDDQNPTVYPGAPDPQGDGVDQNCDGLQDCFLDADGDGWGGPTMQASSAPNCLAPGISAKTGDCNDIVGIGVAINPDAPEKVNDGIDENCDGREECYQDLDGDRFGRVTTGTTPVLSCAAAGFANNNLDCNDEPAPGMGAIIYPGAPEIPLDGFDESCDGTEICYLDADNDRYGSNTQTTSAAIGCDAAGVSLNNLDCKDSDARIRPNAAEVPASGVDENCDGSEDCYLDNDQDHYGRDVIQPSTSLTCSVAGVAPNMNDCDDNDGTVYPGGPPGKDCSGQVLCYQDTDKDGYGGTQLPMNNGDPTCTQLDHSKVPGDCNDSNINIHPGATESVATLGDQDCDGYELCYQDLDDDGYGGRDGAGQPITTFATDTTCNGPFLATNALDCDDFDAATNPTAPEIPADGADNDCDGLEICYRDNDRDKYGDPNQFTAPQIDLDCYADPSAGYANNGDDCNDADQNVHPTRLEIPVDGIDQDCDGADLCYQDVDGDTYGNDRVTVPSSNGLVCTGPGVSYRGGDCLDALPDGARIYPGAPEIPGDGIDEDCNTKELCYLDADRDKFGTNVTQETTNLGCDIGTFAKVGGDCNDADVAVNPGATELPADGRDQNCDAREDCWLDRDKDDYGDTQAKDASTDFSCLGVGVSGQDVSNVNTDCYDLDPNIHPGAPEIPGDGLDQNCDTKEACYMDQDQDHHGAIPGVLGLTTTLDCSAPRFAPIADDCNDGNSAIYPGAVDVPVDGLDNDCDLKENCYRDDDFDTYGQATIVGSLDFTCQMQGVSRNNLDCNDLVPEGAGIHPGATELPGDGIDQDCNLAELCWRDADGDHVGVSTTVVSPSFNCDTAGSAPINGDCNDADAAVYPGRLDIPANGKDDDCDGQELCYQDYDRDSYGSTRTVYSSDLVCNALGESATSDDCLDAGTIDNGLGIVGATEVHPGADETCNLVDDDCDTLVDDFDPGVKPGRVWYPDADGDLWGAENDGRPVCIQPGPTWVQKGGDCADANPAINPGMPEICDPNDVDENCNGVADDAEVDQFGNHLAQGSVTVHPDADADGYGSSATATTIQTCDPPPGMLEDGTDCNDANSAVNPSKPEVPYDGVDNDCDAATPDDDLDGDGYTKRTNNDCNDNPATGANVHPTAVELANGVDDDCDGKIDEGTDWGDDDGDGFSEAGGDCKDNAKSVHPGAPEVVNQIDDDCDGIVDNHTPRYDDDGDGYTEAGTPADCNDNDANVHPGIPEPCPGLDASCSDGIDNNCDGSVDGGAYDPDLDGYTTVGGDCDETKASVHPGANEVANGIDDDCDEVVDEGTRAYDDDADGFTEDQGDCNDAPTTGKPVHPGATETMNGVDDDCDGVIDEDTLNSDDDHDGFAENQGDCDDANPDVNPSATEKDNGIDDDCDTQVDEGLEDIDGDGYTVAEGDCNDNNGWAHPGASEVLDGIDNDCDNQTDEELGDGDTGGRCADGSQPSGGCNGDKCPGEGGCSNGSSTGTDRLALALLALAGAVRRRRKAA